MIKKRNLWLQVLWCFLTLGTYQIYWFYVTCKEMSEAIRVEGQPERPERKDEAILWTVLYCIPPLCLYSMYKQGELYEIFSNGALERWIIFLLWIVFPPAVWLIVQRRLNEAADRQEAAAASS